MVDGTEVVSVWLPQTSLVRLDEIAGVQGGTRDEVASRLLVKVLAEFDQTETMRSEAYSLLDLDEDLAGP